MVARYLQVLHVEDDDAHAELIRLALSDSTIPSHLERVRDGEQAMDYLRHSAGYSDRPRPDLILLDLKMPRMDGHQVLHELKQDEELRTIPVVVLTTSANEVDRTRAYRDHANSYVVKPIDFDEFDRMVKDLSLYWSVWNLPPA